MERERVLLDQDQNQDIGKIPGILGSTWCKKHNTHAVYCYTHGMRNLICCCPDCKSDKDES